MIDDPGFMNFEEGKKKMMHHSPKSKKICIYIFHFSVIFDLNVHFPCSCSRYYFIVAKLIITHKYNEYMQDVSI